MPHLSLPVAPPTAPAQTRARAATRPRAVYRIAHSIVRSAWLVLPIACGIQHTGSQPRGGAAVERDRGAASRVSHAVAAGDDFFAYANAEWLARAQFPPGYSSVGAFEEVSLTTEARVSAIIRASVVGSARVGTPQQQIAALYTSFVDSVRVEALGNTPMRAQLDGLRALRTHDDVARWMATPGSSALVAINIIPDAENPDRYLVHLDQNNFHHAMLGLPREYYARTDEPYAGHRAAYLAYVTETFQRAGLDSAARRAAELVALETNIAARLWTPAQLRDRRANYHRVTRADLRAFAPGFPWDTFLTARRVGSVTEVVLGTDSAVRSCAELFRATPVSVWGSYLAFHWIQNHGDALPSAYERARFAFYARRLGGATEPRPRAARATQFVNAQLGEDVGQLYVARYFPQAARARAGELVEYLRRAFASRLATLDWMDDRTRAEAQAKLQAFTLKTGYPDAWRDDSALVIDATDLWGNVQRILDRQWTDARSHLNGPVRRREWYQSPQTVDASFSVLLNAVELPAGILQPPFFDAGADPAANFGAIGAVIGHEMGHAFDDQGARFDGRGMMRNWWTDETRTRFEARTSALVAQYDAFSPVSGLHVNGRQTLGENIGDLTGVTVAYEAYHQYLRDHSGSGPSTTRDSIAGDRRFFLAYAGAWRARYTEQALRTLLLSGYHAPAAYRVNGVVRNVDAWYAAFGVTPDQALYLAPSARVKLW